MSAARNRFPNVVIRASAGTGKTFQLSNRFIGLALAGEPYDTILATTFTRKAAGEILDRVLFRMAEAALDKESCGKLAEHVGDPELDRPRCLRMLRDMVGQLHRLRVGTLDSFFIQVAQSFSLELGLPPGWQIVDEIVDRGLRAEAVRTMLRDQSTQDTTRLMHLLTKGEASRSVSQQIGQLVGDLYHLYLEAPAEAWQSLPRQKTLNPVELQAALDMLAEVEIPDGKQFAKARDQDLDNVRNERWEAFLGKGLGSKLLDGSGVYYRKANPPDLAAAYQPLLQHAKAVLVGQIAAQTEATHKLLERFDGAYQQLKTRRRALRFEDVTGRLGDTWVGNRLDEVVYRLDAHLSHLLLDEFQDTSVLQWRVLRPFARRVVDRSGRRSFFCVGDVKQAIYGWRGGVAEIFEALDDELDHLEPESLNKSWRSSPVVIDTVNRVFEDLTGNAVLQKYAAAAGQWSDRFDEHTTARMELPGYCRMVAAPRAAESGNQGVATLSFAAEEIARLHGQTQGHTIGVLVRRNASVARLIYELRSRGVDASEEGGNPLTDSPAVQLVLSLLTLADHPGDTAARYHVANSTTAEKLGLVRHDDSAAAWRLAHAIRRSLMTDGYGPTLYGWAEQLAAACDRRDLNRLVQLVELAYGYETEATTRPGDFVTLVSHQKVEDPSCAAVRVMTLHQAKGLQFDVVVLPELDVRLTGQPPQMVVGRPKPTGDVQRVCRYVSKGIRGLLPGEFQRMFADYERLVVEESLCVLYVSLTRPVHALQMIVAPSSERERTIPATSAGLLRAALTGGKKIEPGAVLYEHGDAGWFQAVAAKRLPEMAATEREAVAGPSVIRPTVIRLAAASARPSRGLDRRSPSQLEGGTRVQLAGRLRLGNREALDRGTLVHAWFEQIEWLDDGPPDDGPPDDDVLQRTAERLAIGRLDVPAMIEQFREALDKPAIRAVLLRATYAQASDALGQCPVRAGPEVANPRWEVHREPTFAIRDGDAILNGAIDRLVVLYDGDRPVGADVLDFKTDVLRQDDPQAIDARVEHYRPQLEAYRRAAAAMTGLDPGRISARLVLVVPGMVRAV